MTALLGASTFNDMAGGFPLLTLIVLVPVAGALLIAFGSTIDFTPQGSRTIAIVTAGIELLLSALLVVGFDKTNSGMQFVSKHAWLPSFGVNWQLGVDGISLFLVALSSLMFLLIICSIKGRERVSSMFAWMLLLQAGCVGAFLSLDLFLFFVFFELVLAPMYFMIVGWGSERRRYAALKFFIYTLSGSAFLLVGIMALVFITSSKSGQPVTFDLLALQQAKAFSVTEGRWLFVAFAIAFAVKVPIFPLHTWLADTYEESPIAGVVASTSVMVKLGTYGFVRFCVALFPDAAHYFAPTLLTLAVIGMIYGAIVAAIQKGLKRLLAYASLSHLGFIVLGTFAGTEQGLTGAVIQMVNHGLTSGGLFLLLGMIYLRRGTTEIDRLRGLQKSAPFLAGVFTLVTLASIGVPGLNGFVGELLILLGTFESHRWWAVVGTGAVVLASVYMLWAYQRVFHNDPDEDNVIKEMTHGERWLMAPIVVLVVFLGVYPQPVLDRIQPAAQVIIYPNAPRVINPHEQAQSETQPATQSTTTETSVPSEPEPSTTPPTSNEVQQ